jgi:c-di-GMP-binding flagellar brake protein YcgR
MRDRKKRRHERKRTLLLVTVDRADITGEFARAALIDISMCGAAFESSAAFYTGEEVIMRIVLPPETIFVLDGVIRRVEERTGASLYGMEYKGLRGSEKKQLKEIIEVISRESDKT